MTYLQDFLKPEMTALVPLLWGLGWIIKRKTPIPDARIPYILGLLAIILSLIYLAGTERLHVWQDAVSLLFSGVTQGLALAAVSVYGNQLLKQYNKQG